MNKALLVFTALAAVLVIAGCQSNNNTPEISSLPEIKEAPTFEFTNYDGSTLRNQDLSGDIYIASFFFTSCGGPCPVMNSTANVLQAEFMDVPNFRIVSFTVDPDTDVIERLAKYAERYNAKPGRWYFLRNSKEAVADLASNGFMMGDASQPALHSTRFALVDGNGVIRGYYDGTDKKTVDELRAAIKYLVEAHV
jgi:protein SCO1